MQGRNQDRKRILGRESFKDEFKDGMKEEWGKEEKDSAATIENPKPIPNYKARQETQPEILILILTLYLCQRMNFRRLYQNCCKSEFGLRSVPLFEGGHVEHWQAQTVFNEIAIIYTDFGLTL